MNSCYGPTPNPKNYTTFHARTYLQPQLNKAIKFSEKVRVGGTGDGRVDALALRGPRGFGWSVWGRVRLGAG